MAKAKKKPSTKSKKKEKLEELIVDQKKYETKELISMFGIVFAFVLIIVGLFTPMVKILGIRVFPSSYFIKYGIDEISKSSSGLAQYLAIGHYGLVAATWLLAFLSTSLLLAFWIVKIVKLFKIGESNFDYKKLNRWMCGFITPYLLIVCSTLTGSFFTIQGTATLSYGTLLVFVGLITILAIDSINSMDEIINSLGTFIVDRILILFAITLPFWYMSIMGYYEGDELLYSFSPYSFVNWLLYGDFSDIGEVINAVLMVGGVLFVFISIIFIPLVLRAIHNSTKIIFSSISFVCLTAGFVQLVTFNKYNVKTHAFLTTSFYLLYVAVLAVLFLSITLAVQNRPVKKKEN